MTGEWPSSCVDHIDHQRDNDAWVNLRTATFSQNMHNRSMNRNNISGVKGVCWHKRYGKWYAQIMRAGKTYSIGLFDNLEDAKIAVETARASLHKEFACSGGKNDQVT
ncbi:HNH endonuclease, partial [Pantoea ananatis]